MTTILAYRFSAFGDVAMLVPVLTEFLEQNTDVQIVMISRSVFSGLFDGIERLSFHGIEVDSLNHFLPVYRLARELSKQYTPNYIADFHNVIRTKMLSLAFRIGGKSVYIIDKGKEEKYHLTRIYNLDKRPLKKTAERYADVLRSMGFSLVLSHRLRPKTNTRKGIGFAPFAQHKGKILPLEISRLLVEKLTSLDTVYLYGGGEKETEILQTWQDQIPGVVSCAGKLTREEELESISRLNLMISMDSANMHLASLVGTPCVSVWGATHPYAGFMGYGQRMEDAIQVSDLTCRPCSVFGNKECYRGDWACLHELQVDDIFNQVKSRLSE